MKFFFLFIFMMSTHLSSMDQPWETFKKSMLMRLDPNNNTPMYAFDILVQDRCKRIRALILKSDQQDIYSIIRVAEVTGLFAVRDEFERFKAEHIRSAE